MRSSGMLLNISSLPNAYGIGTMGREAYKFVDFLKKSKLHYWQVLPLSQTSYGDSPYQSFSIYAGNPYFIDLEKLEEEGLLKPEEYKGIVWSENKRYVDYGFLYETIYPIFKKAFKRFDLNDVSFKEFCKKNSNWLADYSLFMALKDAHDGKSWTEWEEELRLAKKTALKKAYEKYKNECAFWSFLQYKFFTQWEALKKYANENGIEIIGDIPIYCALDSVEVWLSPKLFQLNSKKIPTDVAGCPPDCFSPLGQLWGNPLYNWEYHKKTDFDWWVHRIDFAVKLYDVVRIDHFRGFEGYYAIPFGSADAVNGEWRRGPGFELFDTAKKRLGKLSIIAEDLGFITKDVARLLKKCGFPGMKVMQFAYDADAKSTYLPCNFKTPNCIVYTGTHDSETSVGWANTTPRENVRFCLDYAGYKRYKDIPDAFLTAAWSSIADTAMTQLQDVLGLGSEGRMNIPSTIGTNWRWRAIDEDFTDELANKLALYTERYNRAVTPNKPKKSKKRKEELK